MSALKYTNLAAPVLLTAGINDSAQTLTVGSTASFPSAFPFLLGIDRGTPDEEVVLCTAKTSTTFTVQRGYDDTTGVPHDVGALVEHTTSAIVHRRAGIAQVTVDERDALAGVNRWNGRTVWNDDADKLQYFNGTVWVNVGPRAGAMEAYAGATAPPGTLLCNGQEISRTTYVDLFAAIGDTYGEGDGSTTFNVPDLRQKFPLGKADSGTGDELGETGGSIDHVHSGPSHRHSVPNHNHSVNPPNTGSTTNGSHSHSQGSTGSSGAPHTHQLVYDNSGVTQFLHIDPSDADHSGHGSSQRHITGSDPDTNSGTSTSHTHSNPNVNSNGSHSHNVNIGSFNSGNSGGNTDFDGTDDTGESNPPYIVVNWIIYV